MSKCINYCCEIQLRDTKSKYRRFNCLCVNYRHRKDSKCIIELQINNLKKADVKKHKTQYFSSNSYQ